VGCNNDDLVFSAFSAYFTVTSLSLATFYMQILLAVFHQFAQSSSQPKTRFILRAFIIGRVSISFLENYAAEGVQLPLILKRFDKEVKVLLGPEHDIVSQYHLHGSQCSDYA
jgi:hypothetical protein